MKETKVLTFRTFLLTQSENKTPRSRRTTYTRFLTFVLRDGRFSRFRRYYHLASQLRACRVFETCHWTFMPCALPGNTSLSLFLSLSLFRSLSLSPSLSPSLARVLSLPPSTTLSSVFTAQNIAISHYLGVPSSSILRYPSLSLARSSPPPAPPSRLSGRSAILGPRRARVGSHRVVSLRTSPVSLSCVSDRARARARTRGSGNKRTCLPFRPPRIFAATP